MKLINIFIMILVYVIFLHAQNDMQDDTHPFQPGIGVEISTFPDTSNYLNNIFIVNDRGEINLPIQGRVKVSNFTRSELEKFIKEKFKNYLRINFLQIEINYRISLLGGFENPGLYMVHPDESLWSVIRRAGGFVEEKGFKKMKIFRGSKKVDIDLIDGYAHGKTIRELNIKSGDVITVPIPGEGPDTLTRLSQFLSIVATSAAVYFAYISTLITARRGR